MSTLLTKLTMLEKEREMRAVKYEDEDEREEDLMMLEFERSEQKGVITMKCLEIACDQPTTCEITAYKAINLPQTPIVYIAVRLYRYHIVFKVLLAHHKTLTPNPQPTPQTTKITLFPFDHNTKKTLVPLFTAIQ
jgi:hypothetical protein